MGWAAEVYDSRRKTVPALPSSPIIPALVQFQDLQAGEVTFASGSWPPEIKTAS